MKELLKMCLLVLTSTMWAAQPTDNGERTYVIKRYNSQGEQQEHRYTKPEASVLWCIAHKDISRLGFLHLNGDIDLRDAFGPSHEAPIEIAVSCNEPNTVLACLEGGWFEHSTEYLQRLLQIAQKRERSEVIQHLLRKKITVLEWADSVLEYPANDEGNDTIEGM